MATQEERNLVRRAAERGMSQEQIKGVLLKYRETQGQTWLKLPDSTASMKASIPSAEPSADPQESGIAGALKERGSQYADIARQTAEGTINPLQTGLRTVGTTIGAAGDVVGSAITGIGKALLPKEAEKAVAGQFREFAESGVGQAISGAADRYGKWAAENPELAKDIGAVANIASILPAERVVSGIVRGTKATGEAARAAKTAIRAAEGQVAGTGAREAAGTAAGVVRDIGTLVKAGGEKVSGIARQAPQRIQASATAARRTAQQLAESTPEVRKAATAGFSVSDAARVQNAPKATKDVFRTMKRHADRISEGAPLREPADIAGSKLMEVIRAGDAQRKAVGAQLGEAAKGLKGDEVAARLNVIERLRKVGGLEELRIGTDGNLDFSATTLSTPSSASARKSLNDAYRAIAGRDAYGQHQLRQEIFEGLGGRKKAQAPLVATEEQGLEAIRQGLADSIETVSPRYRELNRAYAEIANPLKEMRKLYRGLDDASDDILSERGAVLMRRLTSRAPSGQSIKAQIEALNAVLAKYGKQLDIDLTELQDFVNLLDELYPELVRKTSLAGQVRLGTGGKGGLLERVTEAAAGALQASPELRRQILDELLK